ncbi:hypothetical protein [Absidia glauca]|uniref:Uncharacterized protein n=1 Tax=Absidia glauca TaxID=4829 RepID=A0A163KHU2_ABSGL|nr:hypothetical protein [Absidia glauca]
MDLLIAAAAAAVGAAIFLLVNWPPPPPPLPCLRAPPPPLPCLRAPPPRFPPRPINDPMEDTNPPCHFETAILVDDPRRLPGWLMPIKDTNPLCHFETAILVDDSRRLPGWHVPLRLWRRPKPASALLSSPPSAGVFRRLPWAALLPVRL